MPAASLKPLSPSISIGDKIVHVGALSWGGFKAVLAEFTAANLPLPKLSLDSIAAGFADIQAIWEASTPGDQVSAVVAKQQADAKLYEIVAKLAAENLPTLTAWITGHPRIVEALVREASNLTPDQVDQLSAGQLFRVASEAFAAAKADGFFSDAAGFFAGLVGLSKSQAPDTSATDKSPASQSSGPATGEASPSAST